MANETKREAWTPGPWRSVAARVTTQKPDGDDGIVADCSSRWIRGPQCEANAALAALAPEMAALLQRFCGIRKPNNGKWTRAETERSLAELEDTARALLARLPGNVK